MSTPASPHEILEGLAVQRQREARLHLAEPCAFERPLQLQELHRVRGAFAAIQGFLGVFKGHPRARLNELYELRDPLYREVADHVVPSERDAVLRFVRTLEPGEQTSSAS